MNRIYRLVWSRTLGVLVAVAENAKGRGKSSASRALVVGAVALTGGLFLTPFVQAEPMGGQVSAGTGSVTQSGTTTTINQASQNLSLNWHSFNIAPQETVNFLQPSATAIAVNRIFDTNGTQILGRLNANGQVYLINPNGILFGQDALVNVGALVASTFGVNDASLNGSSRTFSGTGTGSIVNQGTINATGSDGSGGYVALLGNAVSNQGVITAPLGTVALGAGSAATLTFQNNSIVKMQVDQGVLNSLAENGGLIRADGGNVFMSAGAKDALLASVVNNTGIIEARTVQEHNGTIILLGGMAEGTTYVSGTLDASAPNGGNGGFIETSAAHVNIADAAKITTAAPAGNTGTWLIDPVDFTIAAGSAALTTSGIGASTLSTSLGGSNVSIATSATTGGNGDIFVNSAVAWSANKLTLSAHRNININANLNATGTASLALIFGQNAVAGGNTSNITTAPGAVVNLPAGTTNFTTQQGSNGDVKQYTVITSLGLAGSTTGTDLQGMGMGWNLNYALGSNIDATPTALWNGGAGFNPLGGNEPPWVPFRSIFDGLGHTISNLTINRPGTDRVGLFGQSTNSSTLRNVRLVDARVTGQHTVGALVGLLWNNSTVWNSSATGGATVGINSVGGLVGAMQGDAAVNGRSKVSNSFATGTVTGNDYNGGLVGGMGVHTDVINSYATGAVTATGAHVGGLVGGMHVGIISGSYATGTVRATALNVGGLLGWNRGEVSNSYATGTATSTNNGNVGGLVGLNQGSVSTSYATGAVTGNYSANGLVGGNDGGAGATIVNSYSGLTDAQMQQKSNFTGFDFTVTPVWGKNAAINSGHPILCVFGSCITTTNVFAVPVTGFSTYGSTPAFTYRVVDENGVAFTLINASLGGTATNTGAPTALSNAGNYSFRYISGLSLAGTGAGDYVLAASPALVGWTVNKADAVVTANSSTVTYNGLAQSVSGFTATGLVNNQTASVLTGVSASGSGTNAGSYNVVATGTDSNYNLTLNNGTLAIGKATATVTANSGTVTYNGLAQTVSGFTATGLVNNHTASVLTGVSASGSGTNAGSYNVVATGTDSNYNLILNNGTLAIGKANATVTANSGTVTYNGLAQTVSGFTATGLVNNQAASVLTGVSASGSGTNAGSYNVVATGTDSNYNLTLNNGTLNIGKANVSVTGMAAASRDFNGTDIATLTGGTVSGTVNGETLGFSGQSGRFDTPSVGRGKVVTVSDLTLVNGSGLASNYNLLQQSDLSADINVPAVAQNVVKTLTSNVLSLAGTRAGTSDLSTNFTVIPSPNTSPNAVAPSNASGSGQGAVANVTLPLGNNGSTLQIVTGGILLPDNVTLRIGNDGSTLQIVTGDIQLPVNLLSVD